MYNVLETLLHIVALMSITSMFFIGILDMVYSKKYTTIYLLWNHPIKKILIKKNAGVPLHWDLYKDIKPINIASGNDRIF